MSTKLICCSRLTAKYTFLPLLMLFLFSSGYAQLKSKNHLEKEMKSRLEQIKKDETRPFLEYLTTQRFYLTLVSNNVQRELLFREKEGADIFKDDLKQSKDLSSYLNSDFNKVIANAVKLYDEITRLEQITKSNPDESTEKRIAELKDQFRSMVGKTVTTSRSADQLVEGYSGEIDALIQVAKEAQKLRSKSKSSELNDKADRLRKNIFDVLDGKSIEDPLTGSYIREIAQVVIVLNKLDVLDRKIDFEDTNFRLQTRRIKQRLLDVVPFETLLAFGYKGAQFRHDSEKLDSNFKRWLANQSFRIQNYKTNLELLRKKLIGSGSQEQVKRMFDQDVLSAVAQYNNEDFAVSEILFKTILDDYPYSNMADMRYYYAESLWMQRLYSRAKAEYQKVAEKGSDVDYVKRAYYRLVLINNLLNNQRRLFQYADKLRELPASSEDELMAKAMLTAGYSAYKSNDIAKTRQYVESINQNSKYYFAGQYVQAAAYLSKDQVEKAKPIFYSLGNLSKSPTDKLLNSIINHSLLKSGLLLYTEGDFENALANFGKIEKDIPNYDVVLISKAWAKFRLGEFASAQKELDQVFWGYIDSNYIYEAMMLSAHCSSLLGDDHSSARKVRYVENAGNSVSLSNEFNSERNRIIRIISKLDELEPDAIAQGDLVVYERIRNLRDDLTFRVKSLSYQGKPGLQLVEEINSEEARIRALIQQARSSEQLASQMGMMRTSKSLNKIANDLGVSLLRVWELQTERNVDIRSDYPLALKESSTSYQKNRFKSMQNKIAIEEQKVKKNFREANILKEKAKQSNNLEALSQLDYHSMEFDDYARRLESLKISLVENQPKQVETDYSRWSDFSGLGMSEKDFDHRNILRSQVKENTNNVNAITKIFRNKQGQLVYEIAVMDQRIRELENQEIKDKIAQLDEERKRYFDQDYFVNSIVQGDNGAQIKLEELLDTQKPGEK